MRHAPLIGVLGTLLVSLTSAGEYGCSTSTSLPTPPVQQVGGAGGTTSTATGGVPATTTSSSRGGSTAATGGAPSATGGATACAATQTKCPSGCVDTTSDHDNCGSCGTACGATQVCNSGVCGCPLNAAQDAGTDAGPATLWTQCGSQCVDELSSNTNCGVCYNVCAPKRCISGQCGCLSTDVTCGTDGACFDPLTNSAHCGDLSTTDQATICANACSTNYDCIQGKCVLSCANHGLTDCGTGTCIDTTKDVNNCGGCSTVCPNQAAITCINSACVCGASIATRCGDLCVDITSDNRYCGNCSTACPASYSCQSSTCACLSPSIECSGTCYDPTSDSNHCGDCNTVCGTNFRCVASACVCNPNLNLCAGVCVNYQTDPANCGGCGAACGAGQSCTAGSCQCAAGFDLCGASCFNFQTDATHCGNCTTSCSASQSCISGACKCGNGPTGNALTACGQACVDAQNDATNCGGCGTMCTPKQMCQGGKCITSWVDVKSVIQADSTQQSQLYIDIEVCNASGASLALNGYSLKYWYTEDGASETQMTAVDYAGGATLTATASLLDPSAFRVKATSVMVVTFGATTLAAGACTGTIQLRIYAQNYVCCYGPQAGDYSYLAGTTLADNQNITAYNPQGLLVWGLEPAPAPQ